MGLDLFIPPRHENGDESLADFIRRRLGQEALDKIAEPLMAGIHVADAERLSLQATFPRFIQLEQKYGSLIKGMLAQMKVRTSSSRPKLPLFMTLRGGLIELVDTIISKLNGELLTGQNVTALKFTANNSPSYQIRFANGQTRQAQAVIMATPAFVTADLLRPHSDLLAKKLQAIRYISTATVSLAFKRDEVSRPLNGFGFVVPKSEPCQLMACTWVSTKFDHRAPVDQVLLRVFVGGYKHQELVDLSDEALVDLVRRELNKIMGIKAQPTRQEIYRWQQGNAQYDVGHLDRIAEIEGLTRETLPGLYLTGSAFRGVGLPDCIHQGEQTAQQVIQYLGGG